MLQVRDARRELETSISPKGEDMLGVPAAIGVVATRRHLALVVEQGVQHMQRLNSSHDCIVVLDIDGRTPNSSAPAG